jgi:zinc transport system substrate-binding protein
VRGLVAAMACVLAAAGLGACGSGDEARPKVVTTAYPLFEAAAMVGGEHVHAINLLPIDPYAPVPAKKAEELRTAALAIVLGEGVQPEVDAIVADRTGPTLRVLRPGEGGEDHNVWLDPQRMIDIATAVTDELAELLPAESESIRSELAGYEGGIATIDREYAETLATCKKQELLVENAQFTALARRYGLEQIEVGKLDTRQINVVARDVIREHEASTAFADAQPSLSDAATIRDSYGVRVAVLDPIVSQTDQARRGGASYRSLMGINLDALRAALSCAPKEH